jgi:hypothetical protein
MPGRLQMGVKKENHAPQARGNFRIVAPFR